MGFWGGIVGSGSSREGAIGDRYSVGMPISTRPVAIVTGAGSGIGRAIARVLDASGHALVLAGRRREVLEETGRSLGGEWMARTCDVSQAEECEGLVGECVARFGRLDVLVNNAGEAPLAPIGAHTAEMIRRAFEVNAIGAACLIAAAWRVFERQHRDGLADGTRWAGGCVVNIGSMASLDPFPGFFAYAASKAAMDSMIRSCHKEGAGMGIRCFAIAPGAVETAMLRGLFDESTLPQDAVLEPEDVARVVAECVCGAREGERGEVTRVVRESGAD